MQNYYNLPHIKDLIEGGLANKGTLADSVEFNKYISKQYPWIPYTATTIDWDKIDDTLSLDLSNTNKDDIREFISKTSLAHYQSIGMIFSNKQVPLLMNMEVLIEFIDDLMWSIPLVAYFVGLEFKDEMPILHYRHFIEATASQGLSLNTKVVSMYDGSINLTQG